MAGAALLLPCAAADWRCCPHPGPEASKLQLDAEVGERWPRFPRGVIGGQQNAAT